MRCVESGEGRVVIVGSFGLGLGLGLGLGGWYHRWCFWCWMMEPEETNKRAIAIGSNLGGKVKDGRRVALVYSTLSS